MAAKGSRDGMVCHSCPTESIAKKGRSSKNAHCLGDGEIIPNGATSRAGSSQNLFFPSVAEMSKCAKTVGRGSVFELQEPVSVADARNCKAVDRAAKRINLSS